MVQVPALTTRQTLLIDPHLSRSPPTTPHCHHSASTNGHTIAYNHPHTNDLNSQLKAIEELKARFAAGETLEKTQLKKIEAEASVKAEIEALGGA